jgi:hypothetical protein
MPIQNLSLASIIAQSQQGEVSAQRAVPKSSAGANSLDLLYEAPAKQPEEKMSNAGQEALRKEQEELNKQAEEKKRAVEEAKKEVSSTADTLEQFANTDYIQTFLKTFNLIG